MGCEHAWRGMAWRKRVGWFVVTVVVTDDVVVRGSRYSVGLGDGLADRKEPDAKLEEKRHWRHGVFEDVHALSQLPENLISNCCATSRKSRYCQGIHGILLKRRTESGHGVYAICGNGEKTRVHSVACHPSIY